MQNFVDWLLARLGEKTTWVGIIGIASSILGRQFAPEFADAISTAGVAITGAVLVIIKEAKKPAP